MRVVKGFSIAFVLIALISLAACNTIGSWVKTLFSTPAEKKVALKADAGPDQTVLMGDEVTLDGSGSTGEQVFWTFKRRPSGSEARLDIAERLARFQADRQGDRLDGHLPYPAQPLTFRGDHLDDIDALPAADRH